MTKVRGFYGSKQSNGPLLVSGRSQRGQLHNLGALQFPRNPLLCKPSLTESCSKKASPRFSFRPGCELHTVQS
jgi:hypothetical protein